MMSDTPQESVEPAKNETLPYDVELVALIREKGTEGLNEWRQQNPNTEVNLRGAPLEDVRLGPTRRGRPARLEGAILDQARMERADLRQAHLQGASLREAHLEEAQLMDARLEGASLEKAHLRETKLLNANLEEAILVDAHAERADFSGASLVQAVLLDADLTKATFWHTRLDEADIRQACLEDANLVSAQLRNADLYGVNLKKASLEHANLTGVHLQDACLEGTEFVFAIVDGESLIAECAIDEDTDFTGVGLATCRIDPKLLADLQCNIRRKHWEKWYKETGWWLSRPTWGFWYVSDYGSSTGRLIRWFFGIAIAFAVLYLLPIWFGAPSFVTDLHTAENIHGDVIEIKGPMLILRAAYFSIVTMTTLGFGDIYANPESWAGHNRNLHCVVSSTVEPQTDCNFNIR